MAQFSTAMSNEIHTNIIKREFQENTQIPQDHIATAFHCQKRINYPSTMPIPFTFFISKRGFEEPVESVSSSICAGVYL